MPPAPYYVDDTVRLYHGDMRELLPALDVAADVAIVDPPYGETSLVWDRWPDRWPAVVARHTRQMWCFGSMRMFLREHARGQFDGWRFAQDVVWRKNTGSGFTADRFRRIHEFAVHWYQGAWREVYKDPQRMPAPPGAARTGVVSRRGPQSAHRGEINNVPYVLGATRLATSVIDAKNLRGFALHPTEKPAGILRPLIAYSCPPGGTVLDPFAGSGSALAVARELGMRAVGIEADEKYCEIIARRLSEAPLPVP